MSDERSEYLASGTGPPPGDAEHLDAVRAILSDEATWSDPPPAVAEGVLATIEADPASTEPAGPGWGWMAAAAAIILILVAAGLSGVFTTADEQAIALEGTELLPDATGVAEIRETDAGWWIRLEFDDLPAAAEGTYYEGWVWNDAGEGVSIGTFHLRGGDPSIELWSGVDPADYPSLWVTLEDEDGDPTASGRIVIWGRADSA